MNAGIDYGIGQTNIDKSTGIRFGVIPSNAVTQAWCDSSEPDYGDAACGHCGNPAVEYDDDKHGEYQESRGCCDYACESCELIIDSSEAFSEEQLGATLDDEEYKAFEDSHYDIMILKSPYYTHAQFCSPCAPGAGYLLNPCDDGPRTYCFGHDWFDDGKAPYPVYSVATGELVTPKE
jgi:hypothetical protein